ncbi:hypothetical protein CBM2629_A150446 [Cupriavidus taiwanensis]|nr:hypothetical protein CBM2629_A150446 [Cupriavidus taiwanensis]
MDPAYYQTVSLAEQAEILEQIEWWTARRDQFNGSDDGSEQEYLGGVCEGTASLRAGPQEQQ